MTFKDQHRSGDSTSNTKRAAQAVGLGALMACAVAVPAAERTASVVETVQLAATASRTWSAINDFGSWQSWHPAFASTQMLQGDGHSKGAVRVLMRGFLLAVRERPDAVVTTGSMPLALFCLWAKLFGARIVWIRTLVTRLAP